MTLNLLNKLKTRFLENISIRDQEPKFNPDEQHPAVNITLKYDKPLGEGGDQSGQGRSTLNNAQEFTLKFVHKRALVNGFSSAV